MEYGADFRIGITECYKRKSFTKTKVWGKLIENMSRNTDETLSWSYIEKSDLEAL